MLTKYTRAMIWFSICGGLSQMNTYMNVKTLPWVGLQYVILLFLNTHLLFWYEGSSNSGLLNTMGRLHDES